MLQVIERNKLGLGIYSVVWSDENNKFYCKDFWSVEFALSFVGRKWKHINLNKIEIMKETK